MSNARSFKELCFSPAIQAFRSIIVLNLSARIDRSFKKDHCYPKLSKGQSGLEMILMFSPCRDGSLNLRIRSRYVSRFIRNNSIMINAVQNWVLTAVAEIPEKVLIFKFCLKTDKSSIGQ
jgi:hypothetical protein